MTEEGEKSRPPLEKKPSGMVQIGRIGVMGTKEEQIQKIDKVIGSFLDDHGLKRVSVVMEGGRPMGGRIYQAPDGQIIRIFQTGEPGISYVGVFWLPLELKNGQKVEQISDKG